MTVTEQVNEFNDRVNVVDGLVLAMTGKALWQIERKELLMVQVRDSLLLTADERMWIMSSIIKSM